MHEWLEKAVPKMGSTTQELSSSQKTRQTSNLQPMVVLPEIPSKVGSPSQGPAPAGKRPASPTPVSTDKPKQHKSVSQVERLKENLDHEQKMHKQLAAQISNLLKQVSTLSQTVTALTEELREAKKQNNASTAKQNPPAPEDPTNHEAIKSLIESILGPALKSLNAPAPQLKRAAKQKQTKAEIPQAPAQEPITPTASTSKDSYSQAVRTTPKAKTIEDALEDIVVAGAPEVTPMTTDPEVIPPGKLE